MKFNSSWRAASATAAVLAIAITTAGCSSSSTNSSTSSSSSTTSAQEPATVAADKVQEAVVGQLDEPKPVSCPDSLVAEVGNSVDCTLQLSDVDAIQVKVTVTKVDPSGAGSFDFSLSSLFTAEQLQTQVGKFVLQQDPAAGDVECPSGLEGRVGDATTCTVQTSDGQQVAIKTTVETAGPASMSLNFETV